MTQNRKYEGIEDTKRALEEGGQGFEIQILKWTRDSGFRSSNRVGFGIQISYNKNWDSNFKMIFWDSLSRERLDSRIKFESKKTGWDSGFKFGLPGPY